MKRVALTTAGTLATLAALLVMWRLSDILILFVISLAAAAMVRAPAEALIRRGWRPALAMLAIYIAGIGLPLLLLAMIIWRISAEADLALQELIMFYARIYSKLRSGGEMARSVTEHLRDPASLNVLFGEGEGFIGAAVEVIRNAGAIASQLLIAVVVSIYWTADRVRFERLWLSLLSPEARALARTQWRAMEAGVGAYLRSELIQCIATGALLTLAYWLIGLPYPFLLAFIAALAWLIPLVGGLIGVAAAALLAWNMGLFGVIAATSLTTAVYLAMEFYLEPRLYTRTRYWRVRVLLIMLAMTDAFGLLGLLASPPLATALQIWINNLLIPPAPARPATGIDLGEVHAKLARARTLIEGEPASSSPRIAHLFDRLEELADEVEQLQSKAPAA